LRFQNHFRDTFLSVPKEPKCRRDDNMSFNGLGISASDGMGEVRMFHVEQ
jgi:hypothetical protein